MVNSIKPCPFCGGKAKWSIKSMHEREWLPSERAFHKRFRVQVICNRCHSRGRPVRFWSGKWGDFWDVPYLEQVEDITPMVNLAIGYWNERTDDETD